MAKNKVRINFSVCMKLKCEHFKEWKPIENAYKDQAPGVIGFAIDNDVIPLWDCRLINCAVKGEEGIEPYEIPCPIPKKCPSYNIHLLKEHTLSATTSMCKFNKYYKGEKEVRWGDCLRCRE